MVIATLIASESIDARTIEQACDAIAGVGGVPGTVTWIEPGVAADLSVLRAHGGAARAALEGLFPGVDVIVQPRDGREKRLIVADMDSTMITIECIDELADYAGIKAEVADVTERAMRGELDFEAALDARVALLKGLDVAVLDRCYAERVRIMPGAQALVRTMTARGARAVLVSGGFTMFADRVAAEIGFDRAVSNILEISGDVLAGTVARPIVGAATKEALLIAERDALGLAASAVLAVGDGANDIPMIRAAGLGVAYHAKPKTAAAAGARVEYGDLSALLYAQGIARKDWVR
jgi:phosphoserine phosphatase